jgi:hypothetical protein
MNDGVRKRERTIDNRNGIAQDHFNFFAQPAKHLAGCEQRSDRVPVGTRMGREHKPVVLPNGFEDLRDHFFCDYSD